MKTITFKSIPEMYDKEDGRKPNTTRFTDDWDKETWDDFYYADSITIVNTKNLRSFTRQIVDKSTFKNLAIISWLHPSDNTSSKKDYKKREGHKPLFGLGGWH